MSGSNEWLWHILDIDLMFSGQLLASRNHNHFNLSKQITKKNYMLLHHVTLLQIWRKIS